MPRKSRLYVAQKNIQVLEVNDKEYYACPRKKRNQGTTWSHSIYMYECDLCIHSVDKNGRAIHEMDPEDGEYTPHNLWCPYEECPYKEDFEARANHILDDLLKMLQKGEL